MILKYFLLKEFSCMLPKESLSWDQTKELFIQRKIGVAKALARIDRLVLDNNKVNKNEIALIIKETATEFALSEDQIQLIEKGVNGFLKKHEAIVQDIKKFQEEYGENWKREFFKYCFGQYPSGKVDLRQGPITIYWLCEDLNDYTLACNEDPEVAKKSFGYRKSLLDDQPDELRGTITVEWSGHPKHKEKPLKEQERKSKTTEIHERQHIIFDILEDELDYSPLNFDGLDRNSHLEEVQRAVRRYLSFRRMEIERAAKNEIMAYWRDGEKSLEEIKEVILEKDGPYDYRSNIGQNRLANYLISRFGDKYKQFVPSLNIKQLWREECEIFERDLEEAFKVLQEIENQSPNKKRDYLYLLSLERLDKWRRTYNLVKNV